MKKMYLYYGGKFVANERKGCDSLLRKCLEKESIIYLMSFLYFLVLVIFLVWYSEKMLATALKE